jgi:hypothetical protein
VVGPHTASLADHQATLAPDTTALEVRQPADPNLSAYRTDPAFQYSQRRPPVKSWWDQFQEWLQETVFDAVSGDGWELFWNVLQYVILAAILIVAVLQLLRMDARGLFYGKRTTRIPVHEMTAADIQEVDFFTEAERAVETGNYRAAVRLYYLQVLKLLDAQEVIAWAPRKTNQDYVLECNRPSVQGDLTRLTILFDYAWYGDFAVDARRLHEAQEIVRAVTREMGAQL